MGDARLSLEREAPENFDVLAVDAFSSDSIPVHLLTREAMDLYFRHLKPDGILAVHISNRYLNLQPVLAGESAGHWEDGARGGHRRRRYRRTCSAPPGCWWPIRGTGFDADIKTASLEIETKKNGPPVDRRLQQPVSNLEIALPYSQPRPRFCLE